MNIGELNMNKITQDKFDELIDILLKGYFETVYLNYKKRGKKNNDWIVEKKHDNIVSETFSDYSKRERSQSL